MLIPFGVLSAAGAGGVAGGDYELIASEILGSAQASVTFSSLATYASTYKHLQVRMAARSVRNSDQDFVYLRFNADSTSSYARHALTGNGSTVASSAETSLTSMFIGGVADAQSATGVFTPFVIEILDPYSTTKNTTIRTLTGWRGIYSRIELFSGAFFKTDSITSINIRSDIANFATGSRFSLYGIKG